MASREQWQNWIRATSLHTMVIGVLALTACAEGFKLKDKLDSTQGLPAAALATPTVPVRPTPANYNPILELAAEKNEEIASWLKDPATRAKIQLDSKVGFAFTNLEPNTTSSAETSVLYFQIQAQAGNATAGTLIVSDGATLSLQAPNSSDVRISGYWTLRRASGGAAYIGIDSRVVPVGIELRLQGKLYGNFDGDDNPSELAAIDIPLCNVTADTAWLKTIYGEYIDVSTCTLSTY